MRGGFSLAAWPGDDIANVTPLVRTCGRIVENEWIYVYALFVFTVFRISQLEQYRNKNWKNGNGKIALLHNTMFCFYAFLILGEIIYPIYPVLCIW